MASPAASAQALVELYAGSRPEDLSAALDAAELQVGLREREERKREERREKRERAKQWPFLTSSSSSSSSFLSKKNPNDNKTNRHPSARTRSPRPGPQPPTSWRTWATFLRLRLLLLLLLLLEKNTIVIKGRPSTTPASSGAACRRNRKTSRRRRPPSSCCRRCGFPTPWQPGRCFGGASASEEVEETATGSTRRSRRSPPASRRACARASPRFCLAPTRACRSPARRRFSGLARSRKKKKPSRRSWRRREGGMCRLPRGCSLCRGRFQRRSPLLPLLLSPPPPRARMSSRSCPSTSCSSRPGLERERKSWREKREGKKRKRDGWKSRDEKMEFFLLLL